MKGRTKYCSSCGNPIPPWASGVCYVCVRIEKEYKRYGRRRPGPRSASGFEKTEAKRGRRKKFNSGAASRKSRAVKRPAKRQRQGCRRHNSHKLLLLPPSYDEEYALEVRSYRLLRLGINRLLRAVYGERRHLSQILHRSGFKGHRIGRLRREYLQLFLRRLVAAWCWWLEQHLSKEAISSLIRHYSLDGKRPPLPRLPATEVDADMASAEQLKQRAVRQLRQPKRVVELEFLVAEVARHTLGDAEGC